MIMYDYGNFKNGINIKYKDASITKKASDVHELNFTTNAKYIRENGIVIDYNKIFMVDNQYFTPVSIDKRDSEIGEYSVYCRDLFYETLYNEVFNGIVSFNDASLSEVLTAILGEDSIFTVNIDFQYSHITEEYSFENRIYMLNDIKSKYGDFDLVVDGLTVTAYKDYKRYQDNGKAFELVKGKNCAAIDHSADVGNVLTRIIYQYKEDIDELGREEAPVYTYSSEYSGRYPFTKDIYVEVPEKSSLAFQRCIQDVLEANELPVLNYKLELSYKLHNKLDIFDVVKIRYDALDIDVELKIISITKELKEKTNDVIEIGVKKKTILEFIAGMEQELSEIDQIETVIEKVETVIEHTVTEVIETVVENTVIVSETAQILNCWIRNLTVEYFESNFDALDIRKPSTGQRNFIRIYGQHIQLYSAELSSDEIEDFKTPDGEQVYYTSIGGHYQAYKYFTITDPISVQPDRDKLSFEEMEAIREMFKVKVRKTVSLTLRLDLGFDGAHENTIPKMQWGIGDGSGEGAGVGNMFKDLNTYSLTYGSRTGGKTYGLRFMDDGVYFTKADTGEWILLDDLGGGGDWGDANLVILDHTPTEEDTAGANENTLFIVYDIDDPVARWGSDAFDVACSGGYKGTREEYEGALTSVGDMGGVLDAILSED